ncbi:hypothetical protein IAT40_007668 [Kwoniella sp. CBS 6097]
MAPFDLDACIDRLRDKQLLGEALLREICEKTKEVLMRESNVVHVSSPITVVGDIHGQFHDLIEIFRIGGSAPNTNYLFLVTQTYGFYLECTRKYGSPAVWQYFTDMFDFLTLSVVIDDAIFCVHGGLSPSIHHIDQIKVIDRFREIPHEGPMADLVWSDPDPEKEDFAISPRTVWSAPNYCYRCGNMASILEVSPGGRRYFNVFSAAPENERDGPNQQQQTKAIEYFL